MKGEKTMTYEELIEETGDEIGLDGFTPDDDGVCILASDIGEIVIMDCKEAASEFVLLNSAVCDVPPDANAALLEALKANSGFRDTNGATLSVDPETRRFELSQYAALEDLDPEKLIATIENFATTLVNVRERLEGASLDQAPAETSNALWLNDFIRV